MVGAINAVNRQPRTIHLAMEETMAPAWRRAWQAFQNMHYVVFDLMDSLENVYMEMIDTILDFDFDQFQKMIAAWMASMVYGMRLAIELMSVRHDAFTHRRVYTQALLHTGNRNLLQFWAIEPHFMRKGRDWTREITISLQFLAIEPRFVRKGCAGQLEIAIRKKGLRGQIEIAILPQLLAIEPHFVRKGCAGQVEIAILPSVFGDRTSFRAKRLRFVPSRCHCPCPRLQERHRKEGEGKRARGQEGKRARGQEGKRARGQEGKRARGQEDKRTRGQEGKRARGQEGKRARGQEEKDVKKDVKKDEKM